MATRVQGRTGNAKVEQTHRGGRSRETAAATAAEDRSKVDLAKKDVAITINLREGEMAATIWTTDLSHAYVHENSAYSS